MQNLVKNLYNGQFFRILQGRNVALTLYNGMSAKAIREATAKNLVIKHLGNKTAVAPHKNVSIDHRTKFAQLIADNPWLKTEKLVAKPDQMIKRRGKLGLLAVNKGVDEVEKWISEHMDKDHTIGTTTGKLRSFLIEPFVPHKKDEETYVCIYSHRYADTILFYRQGGVDVGDIDAKALKLDVPIGKTLKEDDIINVLLPEINPNKHDMLTKFIFNLYQCYVDLYFTYLEINPLVVTDTKIHILDIAAKLDDTAEYICRSKWGEINFPPPFGRDAYPEEAFISDLDATTGASLKLTILNKKGRIWTMVAGGGASVIYSDTICDLGGTSELANYGEYSGDPSEELTYQYAKTILSLMTQEKHPDGKTLLIGGGIANFTNVANTFKGIIRALNEFKDNLIEHKVQIFVRRGGPNYQEGLRRMRSVGKTLGVPFYVFGPDTHMTAICGMALGTRPIPKEQYDVKATKAGFLVTASGGDAPLAKQHEQEVATVEREKKLKAARKAAGKSGIAETGPLFTTNSKAIVWGMQNRAVQSMLDFDFVCKKQEPSVVAVIYPFGADRKQKFYWGHKEILIPIYKKYQDALTKHPQADVLVTFASLRAAYQSTMDVMEYPQIRTIAIIAEGIPENLTRKLIKMANAKGVVIIGPATVGGVKPGCFKIGNTGGMMDNIVASKLYRPGSVAYVSKSGGMSNELNNIVSYSSDGVYEGVAIGGDRYPGSTFMDHIKRYQADDNVKMIVLLGEVGGTEEYLVCEAFKKGELTKPLVAWCIGTCATLFKTEVQFGHAGASVGADRETATAKNAALKACGAHVPISFDSFGDLIRDIYQDLVKKGVIIPAPEVPPRTVPMDYTWARQLGLIRKPANFMTSITDERGQELFYGGMSISEVIRQNIGIGGVVSLLWFQKRLPQNVCTFFEICLVLTADHGPAVSGAHNTIICARAGKDLVSSLVSGLLTIGDRFGGALDGAAKIFSEAYDKGMKPEEFVNHMRSKGSLIMGIGHRVKSINNPDKRVEILKNYVLANFPACPLLQYALEVEQITTRKKSNLILNVDGVIGCCFVDMLRNCGSFTKQEAEEYIHMGAINSLFVLGRTIGFIGHFMDQKRLNQGLYRHPWDDITYILPEPVT